MRRAIAFCEAGDFMRIEIGVEARVRHDAVLGHLHSRTMMWRMFSSLGSSRTTGGLSGRGVPAGTQSAA